MYHIIKSVISHLLKYYIGQECTAFPKNLGNTSNFYALRVTWSKFHTEDPHILGVTVQNLVALVTWRREFVHPRCRISSFNARECDEVVF